MLLWALLHPYRLDLPFDLVMELIASRFFSLLTRRCCLIGVQFLCVIKSVKADVDLQAAFYNSKLLQIWSSKISRIIGTSKWSYKDAGLHTKLQEGRKEMLRGLVQVRGKQGLHIVSVFAFSVAERVSYLIGCRFKSAE